MIDATIHFQGRAVERMAFPTLPHSGELVDTGAELWRVAHVVYGATGVELYVVQVADALSAELRLQWSAWGDVVTAVAEAEPAPGSFGGEGRPRSALPIACPQHRVS